MYLTVLQRLRGYPWFHAKEEKQHRGPDQAAERDCRLEKEFWESMVERKPEMATRMLTEPALMVTSHGATKFDHATYTKMAKDDRYKLAPRRKDS